MLRRIRLENWKSHSSTELTFTAGPNILIGIMGAGKTSVVEALSFALFGTFPSIQSKKIALDDVLTSMPERKERGRVEMEFESNGRTYTVLREIIRGKGSTAEMREDGRVIEVNPRSVTESVCRALGMDYDLFSKAVYSEQNGIDYFLRIPKGRRMEHIDRMLRLDRYERAREGCVSLRNRAKTKTAELMKVVADMERTEPFKQLAKVQSELEGLRIEKAQLEKDVSCLERERHEVEATLEEVETKAKEAEGLRKELASLRAGLAEMNLSIERMKEGLRGRETAKDVNTLRAHLEGAEGKVKEAREKEGKLREELASLNAGMRVLRGKEIPELQKRHNEKLQKERQLRKIAVEFPDMERSLTECKRATEELRKEVHGLEARKAEIVKFLGVLKGGRCPACEQDVSDERRMELETRRRDEMKRIECMLAEKRKVLDRRVSLLERMEDALKERTILLSQIDGYSDIEPKLSKVERSVAEGRAKVNSLVKEIVKATKEAAELEVKAKAMAAEVERIEYVMESLKMLKEVEARMAEQTERERELGQRLKGLDDMLKGADIVTLRRKLTDITSKRSAASARLSSLLVRLEEKEEFAVELKEKTDGLLKYRKDVEEGEAVVDFLGRLEGVLSLTQQQLREEFVKSVNRIMGALWGEIYPYGDFSEVRLGVDGDYMLQLKKGSEWVSADGIASGGERSLACLALRVAFSLAFMPRLRWLILDEPTHNLDRNAVERLAEVLRERSHLFAEQIFVITHDERLSEGIPAIRLERDKTCGGYTKVCDA